MLILLGVVVDGSIIASALEVCSFCKLITCEQVSNEETSELRFVVVTSENILMVDEISSEKEDKTFKVYDFRVNEILYES